MWSCVASWRVPSVLTMTPLTCTRPARMISSALRRLAMPACARIFCRRSPLGSLLLGLFDPGLGIGCLVIVTGFLTAELLIAVGYTLLSPNRTYRKRFWRPEEDSLFGYLIDMEFLFSRSH